MSTYKSTSRSRFNLGKRTYQNPRTYGENGTSEPQPVFIPLKKWCEENNYSLDQARTLMKRGYLAVIKEKNRMFVKQICEIDD